MHVGIAPATPADGTTPQGWASPSVFPMMVVLVIFQAFAFVGSVVGGHLARQRRKELEVLNKKMREVLNELQRSRLEEQDNGLLCEANPEEAMTSYRKALENSLNSPSAAHPVEAYGMTNMSLASSRRQVSKLLNDARMYTAQDRYEEALAACNESIELAEQIADKRAIRAVYRTRAKTQKLLRDYTGAIVSLERALELSKVLEERSGDVETLGSLADIYVEIGDFERASKLYDQVIEAIHIEDTSAEATSSSWDC